MRYSSIFPDSMGPRPWWPRSKQSKVASTNSASDGRQSNGEQVDSEPADQSGRVSGRWPARDKSFDTRRGSAKNSITHALLAGAARCRDTFEVLVGHMRRGGRFFYESERKRDPDNEASDEADSQFLRRSPSDIDLTYYGAFTTQAQLESWMATVKGKNNDRSPEMLAEPFSPKTTHSTSGAAHARSRSDTESQPTAVAPLDHTLKNSKLDSFKSWLSRRLRFMGPRTSKRGFCRRSADRNVSRSATFTSTETGGTDDKDFSLERDEYPVTCGTARSVTLKPVGGTAATRLVRDLTTHETDDGIDLFHDGYDSQSALGGFGRALRLLSTVVPLNGVSSRGSDDTPMTRSHLAKPCSAVRAITNVPQARHDRYPPTDHCSESDPEKRSDGKQESPSSFCEVPHSSYNTTKKHKLRGALVTSLTSSLRNMYNSGKRWMLKTVPSSFGNSLAYVTHIVGRATCGLSGEKSTGSGVGKGRQSMWMIRKSKATPSPEQKSHFGVLNREGQETSNQPKDSRGLEGKHKRIDDPPLITDRTLRANDVAGRW